MPSEHADRETAMHLLRAGCSTREVAQQLGRSERWVRKWRQRFAVEGWLGLCDHSRAPKHCPTRLPDSVRCAALRVRSELEADMALDRGLKYIGGRAVRTRLKAQGWQPLPSVPMIERWLREAGMTRPRAWPQAPEWHCPHLQPTQPHQLCQIDIVPHYLTGGQPIACFNALDVVSRYPAGQAYLRQGAQEAAEFCVHVWQTLGIARYTQVDNQDCFSGGHSHPYVLGKLVRLALAVGTELVFSPVRHPASNGYVERFHQEYDRHVWDTTYLADLAAVGNRGQTFFADYRQSRHHTALHEQTPQEVHEAIPPRRLSADFTVPSQRPPLYAGRVHFMRQVQSDGTIKVLNVAWPLTKVVPQTGVWATLALTADAATLTIYDAAPDATVRTCLATHPFPLTEEVLPGCAPAALSRMGSHAPAAGDPPP